MEHMEFRLTSLEVAFQNKTLEFDTAILMTRIDCAVECAVDPKCLAYNFDQLSKCTLMTQFYKFTPGTAQWVSLKTKGQKNLQKDLDISVVPSHDTKYAQQKKRKKKKCDYSRL